MTNFDYIRIGEVAKKARISSIKLSSLPSFTSCSLSRDDEGFHILINRYESNKRQRFSVSFMLSIFKLATKSEWPESQEISYSVLYKPSKILGIERRAKKLAIRTLIPETFFAEQSAKLPKGSTFEENIIKLADIFKVLPVLIEIRMSVKRTHSSPENAINKNSATPQITTRTFKASIL